MSAIRYLHVERFRSLRDVRMDGLPGFGVLIGPNGAGKSNLLRALQLLSFVSSRSLKRFVIDEGGASALLYRGGQSSTAVIEIGLEDDQGALDYRLVLRRVADEGVVIEQDAVLGGGTPWVPVTQDEQETRLETSSSPAAKRILHVLQRLKSLHVHDTSPRSELRSNARESDDQYLRSNGSNLASYLKRLRDHGDAEGAAAFRRIAGLVRRVAPYIKDLDPTPAGGGAVRLDWVDALDDRYSVGQLSDGTLRAIAILTMLAQPVERLPRFVAIDEPELGLHPSAIALVCDLARSVASRCQVLFATQSPMVLPEKEPHAVFVVDRDERETRVRRLDPADLQGWLDAYTLPELWDMNVLGGRP